MHNQRSRKIFSIVTLKLWYQYPVIDGIYFAGYINAIHGITL